jgi:hypothetical protein
LFIELVVDEIKRLQIRIGHLKFLLKGGEISQKISFTSISEENWKNILPALKIGDIQIMVNSRIETSPAVILSIVKKGVEAINSPGVFITESHEQVFKPGFPNPTHRITRSLPCCDDCRCIKNLNSSQIEACLCEDAIDGNCCCSI